MNKWLLGIIFLISGCSGLKNSNLKKELIQEEEKFSYVDKNGEYLVKTSSGFNKKENVLYTKRSIINPNKETDNVLEQSIVFSDIGTLKKKTEILRPKMSQYSVWFDGKKYFSELKLNTAKKAIDIKMISPESQWNGTKQIKLPNTKLVYCFFSQVVECAKTAGFLKISKNKESAKMKFFIIWEGYPYLNETYSDFPSELFSKASLEYEGKTKDAEDRFTLKVAGQSIFFIVDKKDKMSKMFWVSQGITLISAKSKGSSADNDAKDDDGSNE